MSAVDIVRLVGIILTFWTFSAIPVAVVQQLARRGVEAGNSTFILLFMLEVALAGGIVGMITNLHQPLVWYGAPRYFLITAIGMWYLAATRKDRRRTTTPAWVEHAEVNDHGIELEPR